MVAGGISLDDIVFSDNAAVNDHARIVSCKVSAFIQADHNPLAVVDPPPYTDPEDLAWAPEA
jgi:hypothetical protein